MSEFQKALLKQFLAESERGLMDRIRENLEREMADVRKNLPAATLRDIDGIEETPSDK